MKRSAAIAMLTLVLALPLAVAAQPADSSAPTGVVAGNQAADLYPLAFGNVLGLQSTLFLSSVQGGDFEVVSRGTNGQVNSFPIQIAPGTVQQIPMQDIGIAEGTGMILVRAVGTQTVGFSGLVVQTQAGGVDIVQPVPADPRALDSGSGGVPGPFGQMRFDDDDFDDNGFDDDDFDD